MNDWRWRIITGDSRDFLARIPDNSIDLILTDPPYNIGQYSTGNIPLPGRSSINNDLADWDLTELNPEEWADEFVRILKPEGNLFIFTSYNQIGLWHAALDSKFTSTNFMVWHKINPAPQIFKKGFLNSCELILTCWNKHHVWNFKGQNEMHNFFESPICMRPERLTSPKHPAQKPVRLLQHIIEIASKENAVVFDPFMGVGSVGVAALGLNRKYIGIELDKEYSGAARKRLEDITPKDIQNAVGEPFAEYAISSLFDASDFHTGKIERTFRKTAPLEPCDPIIKWPGGKERELAVIHEALPKSFDRYYEPFVGGGSVFSSLSANEFYINDLSVELVNLYNQIKSQNRTFYEAVGQIDDIWTRGADFCAANPQLKNIYKAFGRGELTETAMKDKIKELAFSEEILKLVPSFMPKDNKLFCNEIFRNAVRKLKRMKDLEHEKGALCEKDLDDNIETVIKGSIYMYMRAIYNNPGLYDPTSPVGAAVFMFIRNYCYSGMFRYNAAGEFNVPYGGIAYNSKRLIKKLQQYKSTATAARMERCEISALDFEEFLSRQSPDKHDFIFLDPPYDTEFSTYAKNKFGRSDQERLAEYLIDKCKAKWMLIIKNTDFIYGLYDKPGINIASFDKKYAVSFMNRNNREVTHLLITNYTLGLEV